MQVTTALRFNGKEFDPEVAGNGNQYDYGFRIYNPRIGRFLSVDPLTRSYPMLTPYQFASNTPIQAIDLDGLEMLYTPDMWYVRTRAILQENPDANWVSASIQAHLELSFSNPIVSGVIEGVFSPFNAVSYNHYASNTDDPEKKLYFKGKADAEFSKNCF